MPLLHDVCAVAEQLWPGRGAEEWDAIGLVAGNRDDTVSTVLLAVDVTDATVAEAMARGADLVVAHHPLILRGTTTVAEDTYKGALVSRLIRGECALLTAHTNADVVPDGVSDVLATELGLTGRQPLVVTGDSPNVGLGRVGDLSVPERLEALVERLAGILPATAGGIRVAGERTALVRRVALCGGAGDSLLSNPLVRSADVYITSDLRHHPASESREQTFIAGGPALIDVSHWASESLWLRTAARQLSARFPDINVYVSQTRTDPWDFVVASSATQLSRVDPHHAVAEPNNE